MDTLAPRYFNKTQLCKVLNIHRSTLYRWVKDGKFPQAEAKGVVAGRYDIRKVEAFLQEQEQAA